MKFAFFSEDSGQDLLLRDLFRNASFQPTRQHNSTQLSTILRLVERGDLVAIAHNNALIIYSENLDVCSIPFEPPYVLHLVLAWSAGGQKEKSIRRLADCISRDPYKNLRERVLSFLAEKGV